MVPGDTLVASELRIRRALWRVRRLPLEWPQPVAVRPLADAPARIDPEFGASEPCRRVARQEVPNLDRFRRFDAAQRFPAESNDLRRVDLETCVGFDDGLYRLAPWSVGLICCARLLLLDAQVHW